MRKCLIWAILLCLCAHPALAEGASRLYDDPVALTKLLIGELPDDRDLTITEQESDFIEISDKDPHLTASILYRRDALGAPYPVSTTLEAEREDRFQQLTLTLATDGGAPTSAAITTMQFLSAADPGRIIEAQHTYTIPKADVETTLDAFLADPGKLITRPDATPVRAVAPIQPTPEQLQRAQALCEAGVLATLCQGRSPVLFPDILIAARDGISVKAELPEFGVTLLIDYHGDTASAPEVYRVTAVRRMAGQAEQSFGFLLKAQPGGDVVPVTRATVTAHAYAGADQGFASRTHRFDLLVADPIALMAQFLADPDYPLVADGVLDDRFGTMDADTAHTHEQ